MNTIGLPIANVCYFYSNILSLLITIENLSIFVKPVEKFSKKYMASPKLICMAVFILCFIIDFPYFFFYVPSTQLVNLSSNETYLFTNYEISEFTHSHIGHAILYFQYVARDIVPIILLVFLNSSLIVQLNRYVRKRAIMTSQPVLPAQHVHAVSPEIALAVRAEFISKAVVKARRTTINATRMVCAICLMAFGKNTIILVSIIYSSVHESIVGESYFVNLITLVEKLR
jgi:hypothetical protein